MRISLKAALAAGLALGAAAALAQGGTGWYGIGQAVAQPDAASVSIAAHGDAHNHEIMVCVEGHAMKLTDATLHFEGGGTQSMRIRQRLDDGGCSDGKGLSGRNHAVTSAEIGYDQAVLAGGSAHVQLFVR